MKKWWKKAVGALVLSVVLLSILMIPNTWAMLSEETLAQPASPAASPMGQGGRVAPEQILLRGEEAFAKLLDLGFSQEEVDRIRQEADRIRQGSGQPLEEGGAAPTGAGGDVEWLSCAQGQGAWALFETTIGPISAAYLSTKGLEPPMVDVCPDAFCVYIHGITGSPDRAYLAHIVAAAWAEHLAVWCQ
jgi:hypothetical protein